MLRQIKESDKQIYFELSKQFYASGAALHPIGDDKREKFWKTISDGVLVNGYIIEADGQVAGYALTVPYASQEVGGIVLWIDELFILPQFRGRGLAKEFFKFIDNLSGSSALRLEVEPDNAKAMKLYKSIDFKELPYVQMIKIKEDK